MLGIRWSCWRASMSAASSCLGQGACGRSVTSKAKPWPSQRWAPASTPSSRASWPTWVWTPGKDIQWVTHPPAEAMQLFAEGKVDAYLGFSPDPQHLRAHKIGQVVVNSSVDRPWSQYFCCMAAGNREFVRK